MPKTPKKRKRVTDKQRLDFLQKDQSYIHHLITGDGEEFVIDTNNGEFTHKNIRKAIDAAIEGQS